MAVKIIVVEKKDVEVLNKYLPAGNSEGVVLVFPDAIEADEEKQVVERKLGTDYDFGGEADCLVDVVRSADHPFFQDLDD